MNRKILKKFFLQFLIGTYIKSEDEINPFKFDSYSVGMILI
jgi:hypothetical protein